VDDDRLSRELAARQFEAADIGPRPQLLTRRELMADAEADHRIDPLDRA